MKMHLASLLLVLMLSIQVVIGFSPVLDDESILRMDDSIAAYPSMDIEYLPNGHHRLIRSVSPLPSPGSAASGNLSDWMSAYVPSLAEYPLTMLTLPGTHDSGAYELTTQLAPDAAGSDWLDKVIQLAEKLGIPIEDIITPWALAQSYTWYEQAMNGIRYFDVRACWNGSDWLTYHFETGLPLRVLFTDLAKFHQEHPKEVIIAEVQILQSNSPTVEQQASLGQTILQLFQGAIYPADLYSIDTLTYGQLIQNQTTVIVTWDDENSRIKNNFTSFFPGNTIINTYANKDKLSDMEAYNNGQISTFNSQHFPSQLYKLSWTLTPQGSTIVAGVLPGFPKSLAQLAAIANKDLDNWTQTQDQKKYRLGNIFIIDQFQTTDVINVIQKNLQLPFPH